MHLPLSSVRNSFLVARVRMVSTEAFSEIVVPCDVTGMKRGWVEDFVSSLPIHLWVSGSMKRDRNVISLNLKLRT